MAWYDYNSRFYNVTAFILAATVFYFAITKDPNPNEIQSSVLNTQKGKYEIVYDPKKPLSEYSPVERTVLYFAKDRVSDINKKIDEQQKNQEKLDDIARPKIQNGATVRVIVTSINATLTVNTEEITLVIGSPALKQPYIDISNSLIGLRQNEVIVVNTMSGDKYRVEVLNVQNISSPTQTIEPENSNDNQPN